MDRRRIRRYSTFKNKIKHVKSFLVSGDLEELDDFIDIVGSSVNNCILMAMEEDFKNNIYNRHMIRAIDNNIILASCLMAKIKIKHCL